MGQRANDGRLSGERDQGQTMPTAGLHSVGQFAQGILRLTKSTGQGILGQHRTAQIDHGDYIAARRRGRRSAETPAGTSRPDNEQSQTENPAYGNAPPADAAFDLASDDSGRPEPSDQAEPPTPRPKGQQCQSWKDGKRPEQAGVRKESGHYLQLTSSDKNKRSVISDGPTRFLGCYWVFERL
jgi:hypothetical protein